MNYRITSIYIIFFAFLAGIGYFIWQQRPPAQHVYQPQSGKKIYNRNCAGCHGVSGKGNGPAAEYLFPKPRDFTSGVYKFTSTPNGELPTDKDLEEVVAEGLSPSGMPGFNGTLSDRQIAKVVDYIKTFSKKFEQKSIPEPVTVSTPPDPLLTEARINEGAKLYDKLGCQSCHGPQGKGNGPNADNLTNRWGEPIQPRDLTRGNFKGGESPTAVYRRIVTGINGAGMPPYGGALKKEAERWALVAYVKSLSRGNQSAHSPTSPEEGLSVKKVNVKKEKLKDPTATIWDLSQRVQMPLYSLWLTDRTPFDSVEIRALHNSDELAVRLSWADPTKNMTAVEVKKYTDAAAVMFPNLDGAVPFLGMGGGNMRGGMAHIWHWRAADQFAVNRGGARADMEEAYPKMQVSYYPMKDSFKPGSKAHFINLQQHTKTQPRIFQTGWAANNVLSEPKINSPVRSYRAKGFGTLTALKKKNMKVNGEGVYRNGRWQVVILRPMKTKTKVVQFKEGEEHSAAFAVWDGEQHDRNGKKDITSWITLKVRKKD